jgi:2-keto-4-pentenoate hydratase/2-oxohepta-3-ene-1,7-dioic acid hydratase in catechol pathway
MRWNDIRATLLCALLTTTSTIAVAQGATLDRCLSEQGLPRVARLVDPNGAIVYARVLEESDGRPTRVSPIAPSGTPLHAVFERAAAAPDRAPSFTIPSAEAASRVCAPVDLPEAQIDAEARVIVAAGLNYAAHAEEAGGGDVFLFPKPAAPTGPYSRLDPPYTTPLLDYEVELAFVLLDEVGLQPPPTRAELLERTAYFVSNDVTDRAPIVREKALSGPGLGFVEGKGQRGFLPAGPWMVRGTELFGALEACGADGLGLTLSVNGKLRQSSNTRAMILPPAELLARLGEEVARAGRRTPMPFERDGRERFYPLAIGDDPPRLNEGSVVLTGTPDGVALTAPSPFGVTVRGLWHLRSPFEQFLAEELARVASGEETSYLKPGDRVVARIDGLGSQAFEIGRAGAREAAGPCDPQGKEKR